MTAGTCAIVTWSVWFDRGIADHSIELIVPSLVLDLELNPNKDFNMELSHLIDFLELKHLTVVDMQEAFDKMLLFSPGTNNNR